MKLLYCKKCQDVFRLISEETRSCRCGKTSGKYISHLEAEFTGKFAVTLGISNDSFLSAIKKQPVSIKGQVVVGERFEAFVIPKECNSFKRAVPAKVAALQCPLCKEWVYSRARHDMNYCSCKNIFVDGGFDYFRAGGTVLSTERAIITLPWSEGELYHDWNSRKDEFGKIPADQLKNYKYEVIVKPKPKPKWDIPTVDEETLLPIGG